MRRFMLIAAVLAVLVGVLAVPAAADPPIEAASANELDRVNPCTGEPNVVTLTGTARIHPGHPNNFVARTTWAITTSDGYTGSGVENMVLTKSIARAHLTLRLSNGEGSRYHIISTLVFNIDQQELKVFFETSKCNGRGV